MFEKGSMDVPIELQYSIQLGLSFDDRLDGKLMMMHTNLHTGIL